MASSAETILEARSAVNGRGGARSAAAGARTTELFERHGRMVLGLCRMLLRDASEAEDAAQQTFLSAYRSLLGGTEPRQPAAWLATIARNECWARTRDRMREPLPEPDYEIGSDDADPLDETIRKADLSALWSAIQELPPQQRDALIMREFSGLSYEELAETLDVSQPAVESLLFRARRELRVRLRPVFGAACLAPVFAARDAVMRILATAGDTASAGGIAKIAAVPVVAKLAAGTAAVGLVAGGVAAVDRDVVGRALERAHHSSAPSSVAIPARSKTPATRPAAKPPVGDTRASGDAKPLGDARPPVAPTSRKGTVKPVAASPVVSRRPAVVSRSASTRRVRAAVVPAVAAPAAAVPAVHRPARPAGQAKVIPLQAAPARAVPQKAASKKAARKTTPAKTRLRRTPAKAAAPKTAPVRKAAPPVSPPPPVPADVQPPPAVVTPPPPVSRPLGLRDGGKPGADAVGGSSSGGANAAGSGPPPAPASAPPASAPPPSVGPGGEPPPSNGSALQSGSGGSSERGNGSLGDATGGGSALGGAVEGATGSSVTAPPGWSSGETPTG